MKKTKLPMLLLAACAVMTNANAIPRMDNQFQSCTNDSGFYLGAQLEYFSIEKSASFYMGNFLTGYNINKNLGIEASALVYGEGRLNSKNNIYTDNLDLSGKFSLPLTQALSVHAKLGLAVLESQYLYKDGERVKDNSHFYLSPKAGVGLSYALTPRVSAEFDYARTFSPNRFNDANYIGVGINLKLGRVLG